MCPAWAASWEAGAGGGLRGGPVGGVPSEPLPGDGTRGRPMSHSDNGGYRAAGGVRRQSQAKGEARAEVTWEGVVSVVNDVRMKNYPVYIENHKVSLFVVEKDN